MSDRRQFIAGLLAASLVPRSGWADAGAPAYLSAAGVPDGSFVLCGISAVGRVLFQIPLPGRGHAAAAHPTRPEAIAFARRPGTFAVVVDCAIGAPTARLTAPHGRHFYGHGDFSEDGQWLFTTENDYENGQGRIGVWDAGNGYMRVDEFSSGGIGPHDIKRVPGTDTLVIANGGIDTHPDSGRTKLNIPTMRPNLSYVEHGKVIETAALSQTLHKNSIRHIAVSSSGEVAFGMQWQGMDGAPSLVGLHRRGHDIRLGSTSTEQARAMKGYIGSVAFTHDQTHVVATSPRGNLVQVLRASDGAEIRSLNIEDASGVAASGDGFIVASGTGNIVRIDQAFASTIVPASLRWDNHLVQI